MALRIAQRYGKPEKRSKSSETKRELTQKLSYVILDLICSYIVSSNRNIKMKGYKNIKELFSIINLNDYKSDADIERIDFIRFGLDARITYGLMDSDKVWDYIKSKDVTHAGNYNINFQEMSNKDVEYVNTMITSLLDNATFASYIHKFAQISRDFDDASAYEQSTIVNNWKDYIAECSNHIRNNKIDNSLKNEEDIKNAVKAKKIAGYAADVVQEEPMSKNSPLLNVENIVLTPHIAWAPIQTRKRLLQIAENNFKSWLEGKPINTII